MPRSSVNWASRQRARYIEDQIILTGHINRTMLSDYFGVEQSTGSMDIAAYIAAGGPIRRALRHETPVPLKEGVERGIGAGRPIGSKGYYVRAEGGDLITGSTPERRDAWGLLPNALPGGHREWLSHIMAAYVADCGWDDAAEYFGISAAQSDKIYRLAPAEANRAKVWELFR